MHYKNLIFSFYLVLIANSSFAENFASIKSITNLRAGPGKQYPINWTLTLKNMPVKILEKDKVYSKVELYDGTVGWIWNATISKKKSVLVISDTFIFNKKKKNVALVKKNVVLKKLKCNEVISNLKVCKVELKEIKGYINQRDIWGVEM